MALGSLFESDLIVMDRHTQTIGGQLITTWTNGATIQGELSISNMADIRLAEAQGVKATGTLMLPLDRDGRDKYPAIVMNSYLYDPKGQRYVRVADPGVVPSGNQMVGAINKRQFAVEGVSTLPR